VEITTAKPALLEKLHQSKIFLTAAALLDSTLLMLALAWNALQASFRWQVRMSAVHVRAASTRAVAVLVVNALELQFFVRLGRGV
jgi:hypothetical protein